MGTESDEATAASKARPRGRRKSTDAVGEDSRALIVKAASQEFLAHGYDSSSFRAIARRAGVDPALVHHYFSGKADLFAEAVSVPVRPDRIIAQVLRGPRDRVGENLIRAVLTNLDDVKANARLIGLIRTALGHEFAAVMLRQFLVREVLGKITSEFGGDNGELRATLVATQVVGLIVVRYGVRLEPLASAPIEEVVGRIGPVIQHYLMEDSPSPLDARVDQGK